MNRKQMPGLVCRLLSNHIPDQWGPSVAGDFEEIWERSSKSRTARLVLLLRALGVIIRLQLLHWERLSQSESYAESLYREASRHRLLRWAEGAFRDFSYSWRRLSKAPGFLIVAVLILGLGIGANTAMFSVVNSLLWGRQPLSNERDLFRIYTLRDENGFAEGVSYPDLQDYLKDNPLIAQAAMAYDLQFLNLVSERSGEVVLGEYYSPDFMQVAGLEPFMGRYFSEQEGVSGAAPAVTIVSFAEWKNRYASDPSILGCKIRLNGHPVTIIGVGPKGYGGTIVGFQVSYFLPLGSASIIDASLRKALQRRSSRGFFVFAKAAAGATLEQIKESLDARASHLRREYPESNKDNGSVLVIPARDVQFHPSLDVALLPIALVLMTVAGLVLLVACSNLANLLLMRAASRGREVAIRRALGASRWRLVKLLLAESSLLGLMGGGVGWLLAVWLSRLLVSFDTPLPVPLALEPTLNYRVLLFTALVSLGTGILFGLAPALRASRLDLTSALKTTQLSLDRGRRLNLRRLFVTIQVTGSILLLSVGGLCLHSLLAGGERDFGFQSAGLALAVIDPELGGYEEDGAAGRFSERLRNRLLEEAAIDRVAFSSRIPYGFFGTDRVAYRSSQGKLGERNPVVEYSVVDSEYFSLMAIPLLAGKNFDPGLASHSSSTVLVSRSFAEREWGRLQSAGQSIQIEGNPSKTFQVIGVVEDVAYGLDHTEMLYFSLADRPRSPLIVLARGRIREEALVERLRRAFVEVDSNVPVLEAKTMGEHLGAAFFVPRLLGILISVFGVVAVALAGVGLYGLVSYSVVHRSREMAVCMTLGASRRQVISMVIREGLRLVTVGALVGLLLSALASIPLSRFLYGVPPLDPVVLGVILILLLAIAALASYLPARRISRYSPIASLRYE